MPTSLSHCVGLTEARTSGSFGCPIGAKGKHLSIASDTAWKLRTDSDSRVPRDAADIRKEQELVLALREGDDSAYEELVRSCGAQVLAVTRRYLRSEADAADCFQETFIAVLNSIDSFSGRSSLRQWVRGVAVNQSLMALRKRKRTREDSIEHLMPQFDESGKRIRVAHDYRDAGMEAQLDSTTLQKTVRQCIQSLPDDYRVVVLLRDIDGYSTKETATILGIQPNAVKTRLHRARTALKCIMEPLIREGGSAC